MSLVNDYSSISLFFPAGRIKGSITHCKFEETRKPMKNG